MSLQINYQKLILVVICALALSKGFSQNNVSTKIEAIGCITDTIEIKETSALVKYSWLRDTVMVRLHDENIEIDSTIFEN